MYSRAAGRQQHSSADLARLRRYHTARQRKQGTQCETSPRFSDTEGDDYHSCGEFTHNPAYAEGSNVARTSRWPSQQGKSEENPHVVFDETGQPFRVWRPREAPPLAVDSSVTSFSSNLPPSTGVPLSRHYTQGGRVEAVTLKTTPRPHSPPVGQILPRGRGGIDDVLKQARESQRLFFTLQERRLRNERKRAQENLHHDLDTQREYRTMQQLAEYQEELVQIFGPSMRHIISDTFFDDGEDPVLALLARQRRSLRDAQQVRPTLHGRSSGHCGDAGNAWSRASLHHVHRAMGQTSALHGSYTEGVSETSLHVPATVSPSVMGVPAEQEERNERGRRQEVLQRALDEHRKGRRCPF